MKVEAPTSQKKPTNNGRKKEHMPPEGISTQYTATLPVAPPATSGTQSLG